MSSLEAALEDPYPELITVPYFLSPGNRNITASVGQTAYLHCRVALLGDKALATIHRCKNTSGLRGVAGGADRRRDWRYIRHRDKSLLFVLLSYAPEDFLTGICHRGAGDGVLCVMQARIVAVVVVVVVMASFDHAAPDSHAAPESLQEMINVTGALMLVLFLPLPHGCPTNPGAAHIGSPSATFIMTPITAGETDATTLTKKVSWIRKRDLHVLTSGMVVFASDQRFQVIHAEKSENWTLQVKYVQLRDAGVYECQVNTVPKISMAYTLTVVGTPPPAFQQTPLRTVLP
ncbi:hypothetical protein O3P69_013214 [Scylla paramamosain]|uniref:Ig-like domain-containing protein n=1 Tax=Scylla paramamosain TaxID=85552 RepID=A0AAW0TZW4_SCYPA